MTAVVTVRGDDWSIRRATDFPVVGWERERGLREIRVSKGSWLNDATVMDLC